MARDQVRRRDQWSRPGTVRVVCCRAPLADGRVFIVEKVSTIQEAQGGTLRTFPRVPVSGIGEQGLLGLAFDPGHADPGSAGFRRFFVNHIDATTGDTVADSDRTGAVGPSLADPASRQEVLRVDQPAGSSNHKAGWLDFKPGDANHLSIATGDGGSANDPDHLAQRRCAGQHRVLR